MIDINLGDCLEILNKLDRKFNCIYLDPPFCSGREYKFSATNNTNGFDDRWDQEEYEIWIDKVIISCKNRLQENGSLFFHISAELSFIPEKILRKHFKFINKIFWKKAHGKNTVKNKLGAVVDIIFLVSNNKSKFNLIYVPLDPYYFEHSYTNKDELGLYALGSLKHDKTRKGHFWEYKKDEIIYKVPYGWKITREKFDELLKQNRIHFAKPKNNNEAVLYKKLYKHECKGKPLSNLWEDIAYITRTQKDARLYPTQKPVELLKRIIQISTDENDWILDPVAGSGTTGIAAILLHRNVVLIDANPKAIDIIQERIKTIEII